MLVIYIGLVVLILFLFTIITFEIRMDHVNKHVSILGAAIVYIAALFALIIIIKVIGC